MKDALGWMEVELYEEILRENFSLVIGKVVCAPLVSVNSYATTLRRKVLDIAGKIVSHAGKITLKVTISIWNTLNFNLLWHKSENPIQIYGT